MNGIIAQSGVIPYRYRRGRLEVALVTASHGPHWTIPKGHIEPEMTAHDSAAKEAYEEAGLIGIVQSRCVGSYRYEKRKALREVRVYPLDVTEELRRWPERHRRERRWLSITEAAWKVRHDDLRKCLRKLERMLSRDSLPLAA